MVRSALVLFLCAAAASPDGTEEVRQTFVRVLGPDGAPVPEVRFLCSYKTQQFLGEGPCPSEARRGGVYRVETIDWRERGADEGGEHRLRIVTKRLGVVEVPFDPASREDVVVRLSEPADLYVTLQGARDSKWRERLCVRLHRHGEDERQVEAHPGRVGKNGGILLAPFQPGKHDVLVGLKYGIFWTVGRHPVDLHSGSNDIVVPLPELFPLRLQGRGGEQLCVSPAGAHGDTYVHYFSLDHNGAGEIEGLPRGRYVVRSARDPQWEHTVEVPAENRVDLPSAR